MSVEVEAAVRRQLGRQGRRWGPVALVACLVLAVLATTRPASTTPVETSEAGRDLTGGGIVAGPAAADTTQGTGPEAGQAATGGGSTSGDPAAANGAPAGTDTPSGQPGVSRTGQTCTGSNRQLPESAYGALCVPAFTGDNGGDTSFGVSADEIVVTYRVADSASMAALVAAAGDTVNSVALNMKEVGEDMAVLVDHFNTRFELYGRKVRFETYSGQGDILEEYQNRGTQGAQADAARAKDIGAFADVSIAGQSQIYAEAAVNNGIVVFSPIYLTRKWHEARAPFSHSAIFPAGEDLAVYQANVVCHTLSGGKASRSNDPVIAARDRSFGIIHPENPEYATIGTLLERRMKQCGVPVARRVAYALDITAAAQQSTNAVAQMRAANVTTILCVCDFIVPASMMQAADNQGYIPEWYQTLPWPDPFYRLYPERQWDRGLLGGGKRPPFRDKEPGNVFRVASGGKAAAAPLVLDYTYRQILMLFTAFQAAGPNLTPATMFRGLEQVPSTLDGSFGPWEFGPGPAMPSRWSRIGTYDPDSVSSIDDARGAAVSCRDGAWVRFDDVAAIRGPLNCP